MCAAGSVCVCVRACVFGVNAVVGKSCRRLIQPVGPYASSVYTTC